MRNQITLQNTGAPANRWSNRILSLSLIGIFFLTLFPFRFSFHASRYAGSSPFLLGGGKDAGVYNAFLNVLLFVPFGFGLAERFRERGKSRNEALLLCLFAGALLSYAIEFLQIFIPTRDSGWEDVATNSSGAFIGCILFVLLGAPLLNVLARWESAARRALTVTRAALLISAYFALWIAISLALQTETRISNWSSESLLVVGNDAIGKPSTSWKGDVLRLEIWDHALSRETSGELAPGKPMAAFPPAPQTDFDFSAAPYRDRSRILPSLEWTAHAGPPTANTVRIDGSSWLLSAGPVTNLAANIQKNNQFAIRVVCTPSEVAGADGRILSISPRTGPADLQIRQDGSNLVLWFRSSLSARRPQIAWYIPNAFTANQRRDILFSYDGSVVSLYLDSATPRLFRLGPGTALARLFRTVKPGEIDGYNDIYSFLVFAPGGALLGLAGGTLRGRYLLSLALPAVVILVPPVLLECALVLASGRAISVADVVFSTLLSVAGWLWIDADKPASIGPTR
jgi:VanZ family protein